MTVTVITHSRWRAEELDAVFDLGFDLPDTSYMINGEDGIWCPGHIASMMYLAGDDWGFQDCTWWELPEELLGREVVYCKSYTELMEGVRGREAFVKLARHKYETYPAKVRAPADLVTEQSPVLEGFAFLIQPVRDIVEEHRVLVIDGTVADSSCYRLGDAFYGDVDFSGVSLPDGYSQLAIGASKELGYRASMIDIATTRDGSIMIVEGNPPWSSGWYDMATKPVREGIVISQGRNIDSNDLFKPDRSIRSRFERHPMVTRKKGKLR